MRIPPLSVKQFNDGTNYSLQVYKSQCFFRQSGHIIYPFVFYRKTFSPFACILYHLFGMFDKKVQYTINTICFSCFFILDIFYKSPSQKENLNIVTQLQFVNYRVFIREKPRRRAGEYQRFT